MVDYHSMVDAWGRLYDCRGLDGLDVHDFGDP